MKKNTIGNLIDPDLLTKLGGACDKNLDDIITDILQNSRNIYMSADRSHYIIRKKQNFILYWPQTPNNDKFTIKVFLGKKNIYHFDSWRLTLKNKLAQGNRFQRMIIDAIPKIRGLQFADKAAKSTQELLDKQRLINWARLRTHIYDVK